MSLFPGLRLKLLTEDGREVRVSRQGAAAPGLFRVRRRGKTSYVSFEFFSRKTGGLQNQYIGRIDGDGRKED